MVTFFMAALMSPSNGKRSPACVAGGMIQSEGASWDCGLVVLHTDVALSGAPCLRQRFQAPGRARSAGTVRPPRTSAATSAQGSLEKSKGNHPIFVVALRHQYIEPYLIHWLSL